MIKIVRVKIQSETNKSIDYSRLKYKPNFHYCRKLNFLIRDMRSIDFDEIVKTVTKYFVSNCKYK